MSGKGVVEWIMAPFMKAVCEVDCALVVPSSVRATYIYIYIYVYYMKWDSEMSDNFKLR